MIKLYKGKTKFMWLPVTTSTEFESDGLVCWAAGLLVPAIAGYAGDRIVGVLHHTIASTDSDYATARLVEVEVPVEKNVVWKCTVDAAAALTSTDMGDYMDISSVSGTTSSAVDTTATDEDIFYCVGYISATEGLFILNIGQGYATQTDA